MVEVVARVLFRISYDFFFDFAIWFTVWALLLIAGPLLPEGGHVSIDFFRLKLKGFVRLSVELMNALAILAFGSVITLGGIQFVLMLYRSKSVFPRYLPVPMWIVELCVPIGMGIFTGFASLVLYNTVRRKW